jgi:hypothetical protein
MPLIDRVSGTLQRSPINLDLNEIAATVLRSRPEPYYGTHVLVRVADVRRSPTGSIFRS